ncbi:MAG: glycosyltransferase [Bacteroidota bacterium]
MKKKCFVFVSNDLTFDQRVSKICNSLNHGNYAVNLIGVRKKDSASLNRAYETERLRVLFSRGVLFYASLNVRLFFFLLFRKVDLVWCNDLDTLLPAVILKRIKGYTLVYDSHEYYTEAEGLTGRTIVKAIWQKIEKYCVPRTDLFLTVNESIAAIYKKAYNKQVLVLRNMPVQSISEVEDEYILPKEIIKPFVLLQGAYIDPDRGGMELIEAFQWVTSKQLLVVGSGRDLKNMKRRCEELELREKVIFIDRLPPEELRILTKQAWMGVSLDKPIHLNYTLSLPNKIFDYIHARIPVIVSPLVELKKIVAHFNIGVILDEVTPLKIAEGINSVSEIQREKWTSNTTIAKKELHWQRDMDVVLASLKSITNADS